MPSIDDIVTIAEAMEKSPVVPVPDRCVNVRNRNASCRECIAACQTNAIEVAANELHLDPSACMGCGACTAVCPTEALVSVKPLDADLSGSIAAAAAANGGVAVFACARMAAKRTADPDRFAEVPCLARLDESILLSLVSHGASGLTLVDGDCSTCKFGACSRQIDATAAFTDELLAAHGSEVRVLRESAFPEHMLVGDSQGMYGSTRRGFFSEAKAAAKDTVATAARTTIGKELGYSADQQSIGERLRVTDSGEMPRLRMPRHEVAINALDAIGAPVVESFISRLFATVSIDLQRCNACGMCAVFCPSGALSRDPVTKMGEHLRYLEFSAADCVQCGLCADVCWMGALELSDVVETAELYDFEPRTFHMKGTQPRKRSMFG